MRDDAVVHVGDAVGKVKNPVVMSDHDDRAVRMHGGRRKELHDGFTAFMIERGRGLVTNDKTRFMNQGTGERYALLLAT